jgi:hypothetical protein
MTGGVGQVGGNAMSLRPEIPSVKAWSGRTANRAQLGGTAAGRTGRTTAPAATLGLLTQPGSRPGPSRRHSRCQRHPLTRPLSLSP